MGRRKHIVRTAIITFLGATYCVSVLGYADRFASSSIFSPVAYLTLVLSGLWWGPKGIAMAAFLAAAALMPRLWGVWMPDPWGDTARTLSFFVVAIGLAAVRAQVLAARRAQQASEEKYRNIVEKSLAGILVYRDETILFVNSRLQSLLGYEEDEAIGRPFWEFIHEEDRAVVRRRTAERHSRRNADLHYECRLLSKTGTAVWTDLVSSVVEYEGGAAVLVSVYDITERKENEEKRRELSRLAHRQEEQLVHSTRLAELGELAAGIAHELNQPLTGIKNYARNASYMLEQGAEDLDEVRENLHLISGQVDRAARIIGQMRELGRRSERQLGLVDINAKLRETVEFVMPQLTLSGVHVTFSFADDLPPVIGDRIRLEQVFLNLLTNARQAMEDMETRRLEVRTRYEPDAALPVVVEVADTGKGFSPEVGPKLFTPFFSTKTAAHGTGLGLSISLRIIKDHKGAIEAAGVEGKGATFTVRLPAAREEEMQEGGETP